MLSFVKIFVVVVKLLATLIINFKLPRAVLCVEEKWF